MAYIRDISEERTGYQVSAEYFGGIDFQCDFVMVYGLNETTPHRIAQYLAQGYKVHLMTGIAWGGYQNYLFGQWDGRNHFDEAQTDRYGNQILHGKDTPYMVPTVSFADYLTEKLKAAVDAGVEAIHVEEPEFWDRAGYSLSFQREYLLYYRVPWQPPHESPDARYKAAKLKAFLYRRTIERVSAALKEYATKYGRVLRFYVPTHSLLNYTQWKIISPEGQLADIPSVDGCIAQVWTGTSREKNWFNGVFRERTFETAYLEYGVMQELVKGTGRKMWFLHDPIEDNPRFDWNDYRKNYLCTVTASLLHPKVDAFEICPWPNRVFQGEYPKGASDPKPVPGEYATILNNVFQLLGDIDSVPDTRPLRVGVLMSDSQLYQRDYPDGVLGGAPDEKTGTVLHEGEDELIAFKTRLFSGGDPDLMLRFQRTNAFPGFYGLALPLLKAGLPVCPVLLDNARRYNGYLDDYDVLVMSYEYMKPDFPDADNALADWVRRGGQLIYIGDGSDPYHSISSWWTGAYPTPAEHLFETLGLNTVVEPGIYSVGKGTAAVWKTNPARFCFSIANAEEYRRFFKRVLAEKGRRWDYSNRIILHRGAYLAAAVFDESVGSEPLELSGLFADMYTPDFKIVTSKRLMPGDNALLFDLSQIPENEARVIGTSVRIFDLVEDEKSVTLDVRGAADIKAYIRLRTACPIAAAKINGGSDKISLEYDKESKTALLSFNSNAERKLITLMKNP